MGATLQRVCWKAALTIRLSLKLFMSSAVPKDRCWEGIRNGHIKKEYNFGLFLSVTAVIIDEYAHFIRWWREHRSPTSQNATAPKTQAV